MLAWVEVSIFGLTLLFILVGLGGLIIPIYPGIFIMWLSSLGYGLVTGFTTRGVVIFVVITVLTIAGSLIDNILIGGGARQAGASWYSIFAGMIAGIIGTLILPPIGGIIAAPGVILLLEYWRARDWKNAWSATRGLVIGWGLSYFVRLGIGVFILIWWLVWVFWT
jgi:uncharacterized protein YqgC (DUF456 family)